MNAVPQGYMADAKGRLTPLDRIKPIDLARDSLVGEIVARAKLQSDALASFKKAIFDDIDAFVELSAERYGAKLGGSKGNVQLTSFDGKYKVLVAIQDTLTFDEGLQAAKALVDECIHEWGQGADSKIMALIADAFQVDQAGKISAGRILSLRRLNIEDDKWRAAMDALNDSVRVQYSKRHLRVYERVGDTERYEPVVLDLAGL